MRCRRIVVTVAVVVALAAPVGGCSSKPHDYCSGCTLAENDFLYGYAQMYGESVPEFYGADKFDGPDDSLVDRYLYAAHIACDGLADGAPPAEVVDHLMSDQITSEQASAMVSAAGIYLCPDESGLAP